MAKRSAPRRRNSGSPRASPGRAIARNVREILASLDLFVLPSLDEGMPLAVLEAMAAGLAVVATAVGGVPECVVSGETGLLVPPGQSGPLAAAILELLGDSARRRRLGEAGRRRVLERFGLENQISSVEGVLPAPRAGAAGLPGPAKTRQRPPGRMRNVMTPQNPAGHESPRILIVRLSAIGDVIHTMPVACALRERFPQAMLSWIVEDRAAELLRGHEALDELIVLPRGWLKSPRMIWQLRCRLRASRFDVALDAQGLTKSAVAAWLSGCKRRIGFGGRWGREFTPWLNTELIDAADRHAVLRCLALLEPLGIRQPTVRFQVPRRHEDVAAVEGVLRQFGLGESLAVIAVGAGWPSKLWPAERLCRRGRPPRPRLVAPQPGRLGQRRGAGRAEQVAAGSDGHARAAPKMTLSQLGVLAQRAKLFVGSDTGPLHLAAAVGTPCVGLYGPWPAEKHGPFGPQHVVLQKMRFEGSTRKRRYAPPIYMEAIDVASVCEACGQILSRETRSQG